MDPMISKKEVKKVPFLSWWMILVNSLFMDRDDTRQSLEVIIQAINVIKRINFQFLFVQKEQEIRKRVISTCFHLRREALR